MENESKSLQDQLLSTLTKSKGHSKNYNSQDIPKIVANTIQVIENNKQLKLSTDKTLAEIKKRCEKNSQNLQINKKNIIKNIDIDIKNEESIQAILSKHQTILNEIQDRLHHDVEMAIQQLGLILAQDNIVSDDENDFYVEEIPQATIIRHK